VWLRSRACRRPLLWQHWQRIPALHPHPCFPLRRCGLKAGLGPRQHRRRHPSFSHPRFCRPARPFGRRAALLLDRFSPLVRMNELFSPEIPVSPPRAGEMGIPQRILFRCRESGCPARVRSRHQHSQKGGASIRNSPGRFLPETEEAGNQITWAEAPSIIQQAAGSRIASRTTAKTCARASSWHEVSAVLT